MEKTVLASARGRPTTQEPLLWSQGCGHERIPATSNYHWDARTRPDAPHWVLQYTLHGSGYYQTANRRVILGPGSAFLEHIPGPFRYGYALEHGAVYEQIYLSFSGDLAQTWCRHLTEHYGHTYHFGPQTPVASLLKRHIYEQYQDQVTSRYLISARLGEILLTMWDVLAQAQLATTPLIQQCLDLLEQPGVLQQTTPSALAGKLAITREHLSRAFHHVMGVGLQDYLIQQRLEWAAQLLRDTDLKQEVIARQCGLGSGNYFCRVFRQQRGLTPAQYRRSPWLHGKTAPRQAQAGG
ncbi:MAG: AraC family transcriptional regulator [Phycisphaerae bacterium]